ncbi:MAG TPA: hypothetical protein PKZ19_15985 [Zoogloea sp.]|nr:hypothetical protein [Zoogloea sp.]
MTVTPIAGDSQITTALATIGADALGTTRNELLTQIIVAAANANAAGVNFSGPVTNITVVNGIVTAAS